jgi:hypothetical protein
MMSAKLLSIFFEKSAGVKCNRIAAELVPGVRAIPAFGHGPGHTANSRRRV